MVTYVLGAGASRHAGYPLTTELGNRLYEWAQQSGYAWCGYIEELHELYEGLADLEQILTELDERPVGSRAATLSRTHSGNMLGGLSVAIPEYFHSVCLNPSQGRDLYAELAQDSVRPGDVILTFNYDLACERALKTEGKWEIGDGYGFSLGAGITPPSPTKALKLHGSTNWLGVLFDGNMGFSQASNVYGLRPRLFGDRYFTYLGYPEQVRDPLCRGISRTGGEPALILPTLHKSFYHQTSFGHEWEPFWDSIWGQAQCALESSDKIVIVGYSMPNADERARELLLKHSNHSAQILVFSGSKTGAIREHFYNHGFRDVDSSGQSYFEGYLSA